MTPVSSSLPSPRPLPSLPIELKRTILTFADTQTLGRCCRVSLALLEVASELLYRDVEVEGYERLEEMFCTREVYTSASPQVNASLSLNRIRTFTFLADKWLPYDDFPTLYSHRFILPLNVELLSIRAIVPGPNTKRLDVFRAAPLASPFNPTVFEFASSGPSCIELDIEDTSQSWDRLERLRLVSSILGHKLRGDLFASPSWSISYELPLTIGDDGWATGLLGGALNPLVGPWGPLDEHRAFLDGALQDAEVVVHSEEERVKMDRALRLEGSWMSQNKLTERLKHISVVVDNRDD